MIGSAVLDTSPAAPTRPVRPDDRPEADVGRSRHPALTRMLTALVTAIVLVLGHGAEGASAATFTAVVGQPGQVTIYTANAQIVYKQTTKNQLGLKVPGPWVTRSAATSGTQLVGYQMTVERLYGSTWINETTVTYWATISAGQSGRYLPNEYVQTASGTFRVRGMTVMWFDANARTLGWRTLNYDSASDYSCFVTCQRGPGWVQY